MTATAPLLLDVRDVALGYKDLPDTVRGVSFTLEPGESVGIVGESGCGKTTLARAIVGWILPRRGHVHVHGRAWREIGRRNRLRRTVQMVFQDPFSSLNPHLSARATVAEVFEVWDGIGRREAERQAEQLLEEVGLSSRAASRKPRDLSGGQRQRVGIARALACQPELLVADEPTSALDVSVQAQILNLLLDLRTQRGLSLVLISHDLAVVKYVTDQALVMSEGVVVERGPTRQLLDHPDHPYTRSLVESVPGRLV